MRVKDDEGVDHELVVWLRQMWEIWKRYFGGGTHKKRGDTHGIGGWWW